MLQLLLISFVMTAEQVINDAGLGNVIGRADHDGSDMTFAQQLPGGRISDPTHHGAQLRKPDKVRVIPEQLFQFSFCHGVHLLK